MTRITFHIEEVKSMIGFQLSDEQEQMRQLAHRFAEREIRPLAAEYDKSEEFPWPVLQ